MSCFSAPWLRRGLALLLAVFVLVGAAAPAVASLHTYQEQPGQVTHRSRLSLRDQRDRAWQAVAFKRLQQGQLQGIYLRLVGFPGSVVVDRQRPITLLSLTGQQWQAQPQLDPQTPRQKLPDNVWQYDLAPFLAALDHAKPLELRIPLQNQDIAEMAIAPFVVKEWLSLLNMSE